MTKVTSGTTWTLPVTNGTTGQIYVSAGSGGSGGSGMWSNSVTTSNTTSTQFNNGKGKPVIEIPNSDDPSVKITGRIEWNGEDLNERLKTIEKVLMIPERDVILEKKYPKLKKLYDEYIAALGKYRTFEAIKGDKND